MKVEPMKPRDLILVACLAFIAFVTPLAADEYGDFNPGQPPARGSEWVQAIVIKSPELRADVAGNVKVEFAAPGMTAARVLCWQQPTAQKPDAWGHDVNVAPDVKLDADGNASFIFPADEFPNGPITLRILTKNDETKKQDIRELQLYNTGGVIWNQGIPKSDPPAAKGMKLAFSDDFDGPLSISSDGKGEALPGPPSRAVETLVVGRSPVLRERKIHSANVARFSASMRQKTHPIRKTKGAPASFHRWIRKGMDSSPPLRFIWSVASSRNPPPAHGRRFGRLVTEKKTRATARPRSMNPM